MVRILLLLVSSAALLGLGFTSAYPLPQAEKPIKTKYFKDYFAALFINNHILNIYFGSVKFLSVAYFWNLFHGQSDSRLSNSPIFYPSLAHSNVDQAVSVEVGSCGASLFTTKTDFFS